MRSASSAHAIIAQRRVWLRAPRAACSNARGGRTGGWTALAASLCGNFNSSGCSRRSRVKLIVQPDDGVAPLLAAIRHARKSVDIMVFRFDRSDLRQALADAVGRGVAVRTLIAHTNSEGPRRLRKLELDLLAAGITVVPDRRRPRALPRQVLRSRPRPGLHSRVQLHRARHQQEPELRRGGADAADRPGTADAVRGRRRTPAVQARRRRSAGQPAERARSTGGFHQGRPPPAVHL